MERWLDWTLIDVQPAERPLFWGLVRTPVADRDMAALQKAADANAALWRWSTGTFSVRPGWKATISASPISPSVAMRGAGSASRASRALHFRICNAGIRRSRHGLASRPTSRRRSPDRRRSLERSFSRIPRSSSRMPMITTSVIAATTRRMVQLMPRPIHHSSAQPINTGMTISGRTIGALRDEANAQRLAAARPLHTIRPVRASREKASFILLGTDVDRRRRLSRRSREIQYIALPGRESTVQRDPCGLVVRTGVCRVFSSLPSHHSTPPGESLKPACFKNR